MTTVYFLRHAQADNTVRDGRIKPLTEKGMADRALVTNFLQDKSIDAVLSSPFKRAVDTIADFAERNKLTIDECKASANYSCGECGDNGVARWIEENVL